MAYEGNLGVWDWCDVKSSIGPADGAQHPKRIAIYLHTLYNGGVERVVLTLIQGFLERGIAVDLVLDHLVYSPFEKDIPAGTNVINLRADGYLDRLIKIAGYMRKNRPDAISTHAHFVNEIACLARFLTGSPARLVLTEHTTLSSHIADAKRFNPRRFLPWTTRLLYPLADSVVAVSNGVADDLSRVSKLRRDGILTIYNPINFDALATMAKEPLDHPWFAPGEPPVILAIGRLETQKNFTNLLRAFARVRQHRSARLLILGEGSQRETLTPLAAELGLQNDVSMPGFVSNPASYMARAGVFAMSSSWEGMPMALIEALILKVPLVSTDCPSGPVEILDGGKYGAMVPMDDPEALAAAIERVLDGERKADASEWVKQFDAEMITDRYLRLM